MHTEKCPTGDLPVTKEDIPHKQKTKRQRKRTRSKKGATSELDGVKGTAEECRPIDEPSSQDPNPGDPKGSRCGGRIGPEVAGDHLSSPPVISTDVPNMDAEPLTTKRRGVQIINDDGDVIDTIPMQDTGRLTSTRQDTPMIPAPEDDDVNDWIQNF